MKFILPFMALTSLLFQSSTLHGKEIEVNGSTIFFRIDTSSIISQNTEEVGVEVAAGELVNLNIADHVVIRSNVAKTSFSPLSYGPMKDKGALIGVDIPTPYIGVTTLFQSFYKESGIVKRECRILVLEGLLEASYRTNLRSILESNSVVINEQSGFYSFVCGHGKEG